MTQQFVLVAAEDIASLRAEIAALRADIQRATIAPENRWITVRDAAQRLDSSLGYTEDNCRLICHIVNIARADYDDETFLTMCKACLSHSVAAE